MQPGRAATTMLIEEVETIWSAIADADDWSLFENKILEIRDYGIIHNALFAYGVKR